MTKEGTTNQLVGGLSAAGKLASGVADLAGNLAGAASPIPFPGGGKNQALGICACLGCFGLIILILFLIIFGAATSKKARLAAEPPPEVKAADETGNVPSGNASNTSELDPNSTKPECQELKKTVPGTPNRYIDLINREAKRWKLAPAFVAAIMRQESNFNPQAVSPSGARGLMQIMPATFADLRARYPNPPPDEVPNPNDPFDPRTSAYYGAAYLNDLRNFLGKNDIRLIAAAYNAGPGAVSEYGGIPTYPETQNYVKIIQAFYNRYTDCLTTGSQPHPTGSGSTPKGSTPKGATPEGQKVLEAARNYHPGECSGVDCYQHTIAVYKAAGMRPEPVGFNQWDGQITAPPSPGYIMDLDTNHDGGADHTILFDHEEIMTYNGKKIRVWYYWNADATNDWVYSNQPYDPATAYGSTSRTLPWSPEIDGLPVHMWRPVPISK